MNPMHEKYKENLKARKKQMNTPEIRLKISESIARAHREGRYQNANLKRKGKPGRKFTDDEKRACSERQKQWLLDNPDKHPWKKSTKFISAPCERLKKLLKEAGYNFEEEHSPVPGRFFAVDIAFMNEKIAIEVNGGQHYNADGSLKPYYAKRHDLIENQGWRILELHFYEVFNPDIIDKIRNFMLS